MMITSPQMALVKSKTLENENLSTELIEKNPEGGPLTKKQKRKHTVLACESCHNNHLKCNGAEPCQQCVKRHTDCRYSTPGKRGPKPGASSVLKSKLAQQEMSIQILTEELNRTKHEKEEWRQKYLSVVSSRQAELPLLISATPPEEIPMTALTKYLDGYRKYVHPLYPLPVAVDKPNSLQYLYSTDPQHALLSLQLSIVLAHGARMCQGHFDSNEFIKSAKEKARDFFDQSNYELAHTFLLISYFYFGNGDKNKASYFTALVYKSCQDLGALENSPVGRKCLSLIATESDYSMDTKDEIISKFHDIQADTSELVWLTFMQIYTGLHFGKIQSMSLLRKLEEVESIMGKNSKTYSHFEYLNLQTLVSGCRAGVFWNEKVKDIGRNSADKALELFKDEEFHLCSPTVIPAVAMVIQINLAEKRLTQLQEALVALDRLAELYPLADLVRKCFSSFFEAIEQLMNKNNGSHNNGHNLTNNGNGFNLAGTNHNHEGNGDSTTHDTSTGSSSNVTGSSSSGSFSTPEMTQRLKRILESELELLSLFRDFPMKTGKEIPWLIILNP